MSATLKPCSSCMRHVRRPEHACPFCGAAIVPDSAPAPRVVSERLHRSVMALLGPAILVGAAASLDGCSNSRPAYGGNDSGPPHDAALDRPDAGLLQGDASR